MIEQEVKLQFEQAEAARQAVHAAGGRLVVSRRLIEDRLFDTPGRDLGRSGNALRIRRDGERAYMTFKGPVRPGPVKRREELETGIGDAGTVERVLERLGFQPVFRSQKYREEYVLGDAALMIDEAPLGVFVEIEASPVEIERVARLLGRTPADYRLESYPALWRRWCDDRGLTSRDMLFENPAAAP
jgi:adenylate cyclase class 2